MQRNTKMEIVFPNWRKAYQSDDHKLRIGEQHTRLEIVFPSWRISHQTDDYMFKSEKSLPYWRIFFQSFLLTVRIFKCGKFYLTEANFKE
jgi:hypothetical protein